MEPENVSTVSVLGSKHKVRLNHTIDTVQRKVKRFDKLLYEVVHGGEGVLLLRNVCFMF